MRLGGFLSALGVLGLTTLGPTSASADSMRCGRELVRDGHRTSDVVKRCGQPTSTSKRVEALTGVTYDDWTYDFGPREFVRHLTFQNGVLIQIVIGDYGTTR